MSNVEERLEHQLNATSLAGEASGWSRSVLCNTPRCRIVHIEEL